MTPLGKQILTLCSLALPMLCLASCGEGPPVADDVKALHHTVVNNAEPLTKCYELSAKKNPKLAGRIAIKVTVADDGSVEDARTTTNDLGQEVGNCFQAAFQKIPFPRISKTTTMEESFCIDPDPNGTLCQE